MRPDTRADSLSAQLGRLLRLAHVQPVAWFASTAVVSLLLALLDMAGVAAMIPLTQLLTGTGTESGAIAVLSDIIGTDDPATLIPALAAGIAGLFILKSVASIAFRWWLLGRTSVVAAELSTSLMRKYMLAPYSAHRSRRMSDIYWNINDSTGQAGSVILAVVSIMTDVMMLGAIVVILAITAPVVTALVVALFSIFVIGLQRILRSRQSRIGEAIAESSLEAWGYMMPGLDGFREARLSSSASVFVDGYRRARLRGAMAGRQMAIISEAPRYVLEVGFIIAIAGISVLLFLTTSVADSLTILGVFAAASLRGLPTLYRLASNFAIVRTGRVGARNVLAAADELEQGGQHDEAPRKDTRYRGDIVIRDLVFEYRDADEPVLRGVNLTIPENTTTAFVGSSGAGKSTLLDLVLGLLEPTTGSVECGGRSVQDDPASWYSGLGVVPQDVFLVNDTVAGNVAFGVESARIDRARVEEVIEIARLTEVVRSLPAGLDTTIGERGVRLSGGQRQRLGLARALYRKPSVLVLDEATSALDNVTEQEITETLNRLSGTLTILIVAHRLSTVRSAANLVFLKDGLIEATGTFDEVRGSSSDFAHLVELGNLG